MAQAAISTEIVEVTYEELIQVLQIMVPMKENVLVVGAPGIGKTSLAQMISKALKMRVLMKHPGIEEPTDAKGMPWSYFDNGIQVADFVPFNDLKEILTADEELLVIIDDFGQALPSVQCAYMPILLDRLIAGRPISDKVSFLACTNRLEDAANVTGILLPVRSRFLGGIYHLKPTIDGWCKWALSNGLLDVAMFVKFKENVGENYLLNEKPNKKEISGYHCPRTIAKVGELIRDNRVPDSLQLKVFSGIVGRSWAIEFISFLQIKCNLPHIPTILQDPMNASVVDVKTSNGPATMFAVIGALVNAADNKTVENIFKYADRLPKVFSTFLADSIISAKPALANTQAYVLWAAKNSKSNVGL
jgi:energy-coupling factor transporter ATP-binding protein EcfA2